MWLASSPEIPESDSEATKAGLPLHTLLPAGREAMSNAFLSTVGYSDYVRKSQK